MAFLSGFLGAMAGVVFMGLLALIIGSKDE